jgi:hypothetical protein
MARPLVLDKKQRLAVGAACERKWDELAEQQALARYDKTGRARAVEAARQPLELIPKPGRNPRQAAEALAARRTSAAPDDIELDIDEILERSPAERQPWPEYAWAHTELNKRNRLRRIIARAPKGHSAEAKQAGIAFAAERYGIPIKPRMAKTCWDEWRDFVRRLAQSERTLG